MPVHGLNLLGGKLFAQDKSRTTCTNPPSVLPTSLSSSKFCTKEEKLKKSDYFMMYNDVLTRLSHFVPVVSHYNRKGSGKKSWFFFWDKTQGWSPSGRNIGCRDFYDFPSNKEWRFSKSGGRHYAWDCGQMLAGKVNQQARSTWQLQQQGKVNSSRSTTIRLEQRRKTKEQTKG